MPWRRVPAPTAVGLAVGELVPASSMFSLEPEQGPVLCAARKSIERGDFAAIDLDVALVDFIPEKIQLGISVMLIDVDMPCPRPAIAAVVPAITSAFQSLLEFERSIFSPDAKRLAPGALKQDGQSGR